MSESHVELRDPAEFYDTTAWHSVAEAHSPIHTHNLLYYVRPSINAAWEDQWQAVQAYRHVFNGSVVVERESQLSHVAFRKLLEDVASTDEEAATFVAWTLPQPDTAATICRVLLEDVTVCDRLLTLYPAAGTHQIRSVQPWRFDGFWWFRQAAVFAAPYWRRLALTSHRWGVQSFPGRMFPWPHHCVCLWMADAELGVAA